jgi:hypothetical protein
MRGAYFIFTGGCIFVPVTALLSSLSTKIKCHLTYQQLHNRGKLSLIDKMGLWWFFIFYFLRLQTTYRNWDENYINKHIKRAPQLKNKS